MLMVDDVDPVMDVGLKVTLTPFGTPEADNEIVGEPLVTVAVILLVPADPPRFMEIVAGTALME